MPSGDRARVSLNLDLITANARLNEPDRVVAASLAPAAVRNDLIALAAYLGDVRRIPLTVSDATLGEIRLQWWRDALTAGAQGGLSGNPVADEMVRVIARHNMPIGLVLAPHEAASAELAGEPFGDEAAWLAYLDTAEGAAVQLALACLECDLSKSIGAIVEPAGRAYASVRLAQRLPELLSLARWPVPHQLAALGDPRSCGAAEARAIVRQAGSALCAEAMQHLEAARSAFAQVPRAARPAFLPVGLVPAYGKSINAPARDALRQPASISPIARVLRLLQASLTGRI